MYAVGGGFPITGLRSMHLVKDLLEFMANRSETKVYSTEVSHNSAANLYYEFNASCVITSYVHAQVWPL